jgi:hypothetical protein
MIKLINVQFNLDVEPGWEQTVQTIYSRTLGRHALRPVYNYVELERKEA